MDDGLLSAGLCVNPMRIGVAAQQRDLEEEHARGPDGGRTTKPGQNLFRDERLDLEKQKRAEQDGRSKERRRNSRASAAVTAIGTLERR